MISESSNTGSVKTVKLRGKVTRGIGQSSSFTEIPWVKKQFMDKLGIEPYPGTFNITVIDEDRDKLNAVRESRGIDSSRELAPFFV